MSDFIQNLLTRHLEPAGNVQPRLRGMFEPVPNSPNLSTPGFSKNTGEQEEQREGNYRNTPESMDQPAAALPRQFPNAPSVERSTEISSLNFHQLRHPITVFPEKHSGVFHSNADSLAPLPLKDNIYESPRLITELVKPRNPETEGAIGTTKPSLIMEPVKPQNSETSEEIGAKKPETLKNPAMSSGKQDKSLLRVPSGVQPVLAAQEKLTFPTTDSPGLNNTTQRTGAGDFLEGFNRRLHPETKLQPAPAPVIKVNIGRIEVRALIQQQAPTMASKLQATPKPRLTLEDYLKNNKG